MKNRNVLLGSFIAFFTLGVFITACQKEVVAPTPTTNQIQDSGGSREIDGHALRMEMLELSVIEQRAYFENLTGDEKAAVWHDKMSQVLSVSGWETVQIQLLEDLDAEIKAGIWVVSSSEEAHFLDFLATWRTEAESQFTFDQLGWIIAAPDDYVPESPWTNPNTDDCDCSTTDDWCPGSSICNATNCNTSAHGCGTFWVKSCRGNCGL